MNKTSFNINKKHSFIFIIVLFCFFTINFSPTFGFSDDIIERRLNRGLLYYEPYAFFYIEKAKAEPDIAIEYLKKAQRAAQNLPAVYFELAKSSFSINNAGFIDSLGYFFRGILLSFKNYWWQFNLIATLWFAAISSLLASLIVFAFVFVSSSIPLIKHEITENPIKMFLIILIFLSSFIGLIYLVAFMTIFVAMYHSQREKIIIYGSAVLLLLMPLFVKTTNLFLSASSSDELKAIEKVNAAKDNQLALHILKGKDDTLSKFSYALALKREGYVNESISEYNELISNDKNSKYYINLGNSYLSKGMPQKAADFYEKAIAIKPGASAYYNLSQVSREMLILDKGDEYFIEAVKLDSSAVSRYRTIASRNPNRFVIDENVSLFTLWKYVFNNIDSKDIIRLSSFPLFLYPIVAIALVIFYYLYSKHNMKARKCNRCGAIYCSYCDKRLHWGDMCQKCFESLINLQQESKDRITRIIKINEYREKKINRLKIAIYTIPGLAYIMDGKILKGLFFSWVFFFLIFLWIYGISFNINLQPFAYQFPLALIAGLIVIFYLYNIYSSKRGLFIRWR